MPTALPANTKTWPNVVSMLVQRRWRWANIDTTLDQILEFAGLHTGICLHPPLPHHNNLASLSGYFKQDSRPITSLLQYLKLRAGDIWRQPSANFNMEVAVSTAGSVTTVLLANYSLKWCQENSGLTECRLTKGPIVTTWRKWCQKNSLQNAV